MDKKAKEIFEGNFDLWLISTSGGGAFKAGLTPEDLNLEQSDIDENIHLGSKDMISKEDRVFLNCTPGQVQNFMRTQARRFFGRGLFMVPDNNFLTTEYGLTRIMEAQQTRVEEFLLTYPEKKKEQMEKHPNLKTETWPEPEQIKAFYKLTWKAFTVTTVKVRDTDTEEKRAIKAKMNRELEEGYNELKDAILGESYREMLSAIDAIGKRLDDAATGETKGITETNFKKPRAIIDQYLSIAGIFDLPEIKARVEQLKETMEGTTARDLREKPLVSKIFSEKIRDIGKDLEEMTGYSKDGRLKRTIDLDEDPPAAAAANG